ncbi:phage tail tip lysozyme [Sphingomonas sp.]|uniref:phage tail tip lysozyme n=1 Tax=Sphingomonas sp. TaxID=28214 RepID=UPI002ED78476
MARSREFLVGTYDRGGGGGLYPLSRSPAGAWSVGEPWREARNASFGVRSRRFGLDYLVDEMAGTIVACDAMVRRVSARVSSGGEQPCHLALDEANNRLACANYGDGTLAISGEMLTIPGGGSRGAGSSEGVDGPAGTPGGGTGNVYDVARQYLGRNASDLKTDTSDDLPMNPNVPNNVCCANFVSGVLIEAGVMDSSLRTDSVAQLNSNVRNAGWTQVDPSQAKPGDVVIIQGGGVSHTEIYAGNGRMIGSNNANADGSQRITENNLSWALDHGAVILRAPGGANNGGARPEGTNGADRPAPTGEGTRQQRIDQAIAYFEGQGWTRAQAVGIVANLDAESGMDPNINQIGGGPGYGLAQWEGPRQADFRAWAGKDIRQSSFAEQLQFIQWELNNTEAAAGRALRGADDPGEAASIVTRRYERRADRARDIWNR